MTTQERINKQYEKKMVSIAGATFTPRELSRVATLSVDLESKDADGWNSYVVTVVHGRAWCAWWPRIVQTRIRLRRFRGMRWYEDGRDAYRKHLLDIVRAHRQSV